MLYNCATFGEEKFPKKTTKILEYGTAGFRDKAEILPHVMYRMGIFAALRSMSKEGAAIGVMVTASHNPEEDNGLKLCDPMGEMLEAEWEEYATNVANAEDDNLFAVLTKICDSENIKVAPPSNVCLAMDTRKSSAFLSEAVSLGLQILKANVTNFGLLTTPQLHFIVCCKNNPSYGTATPEGYYTKLSTAFLKLNPEKEGENYVNSVFVDGSNGVGAYKLADLEPFLNQRLQYRIFNSGKGTLNLKCGADFVKVVQTFPTGSRILLNRRYVSFDGDADRLIYFYLDNNQEFHMLDGDKISALIAKFLKDLVEKTELGFKIAVVQTAYANGSSTKYMKNVLKVSTVCVPTGVKHLHREAHKYDIGIYFEANGHGTVVFNDNMKGKLKSAIAEKNISIFYEDMYERLLDVIDLVNETVGDAISDFLLVETILNEFDWSLAQWNCLYSDLPNRLLKVEVPDKRLISTTDADRICITPAGLQEFINAKVSNMKDARAFVRPSGTENVVRVYAEANTKENADNLAQIIAEKVVELTR